METKQLKEQFIASLSDQDWGRIVFALKSHIIIDEWSLQQDNHGDREWQELNEMETLMKNIELYVTGGTNERN